MAVITAVNGRLDTNDLGLDRDGTYTAKLDNIRITYATGDYVDFDGHYSFDQDGLSSGTVETISKTGDGMLKFTAADVGADAQRLFALIQAGDGTAAARYLLRDDDTITGGETGDTLYGFGGGDTLSGGGGDDTIDGGGGKDVLIGGVGRDLLNGGAGGNTFRYLSVEDSTPKPNGRDTILFSYGVDRIDLKRIDANELTENVNEAFRVVHHFTGHAGELMIKSTDAGWLVSADTDGRDGADFAILIKSFYGPTATDFIL